MSDYDGRRLGPQRGKRRGFGLPRRNWVAIGVVIGALAVWQYRGGGTALDASPDLSTFSRAEFEAAKILMTAGLDVISTPVACQERHGAFGSDETWRTAVAAWNDRNEALLVKVLRIAEETELSAPANKKVVDTNARRSVDARLERWTGREAEECTRFVAQMNDGLWDLPALPELAPIIAIVEAAPASSDSL